MRLKLINAICDPERSSEFKKMLSSSFDVEEVSVSEFDEAMEMNKFLPPLAIRFLALAPDLYVFVYDRVPLISKSMHDFLNHKESAKKSVFVIYESNEYFVKYLTNVKLYACGLQEIYQEEDVNNRLYLINTNNLMDIFAFKDKITNLGTEKPFTPSLEIQFDKNLRPFGKGVIDIRKEVALPNIDFWIDEKFVQLTKKCTAGDSSAMMELGRYYENQGDCEFCQLASNYWYYTAYLYGNKEARFWVDKWFLKNPTRKLPMPMLPSKLYKTYKKMVHDNEHCYRGAMLKALGFGFFSEKRTYEMYHFFEPELVQFCSWCNTEGPDEDGFGMSEEYDWWFLDELFNELPDVKMLHSYSFHERQCACTETFDEQYESAKKAIENRKVLYPERTIKKLYKELIFGYEYGSMCENLVILKMDGQRKIVYFYIEKDGYVAYKCCGGEHKEFNVSEKCITDIRAIIASAKDRINCFIEGASWQGMPITVVFENCECGFRITDTNELSRIHDKFNIKPVFYKIFETLYPEIPELRDIEKFVL